MIAAHAAHAQEWAQRFERKRECEQRLYERAYVIARGTTHGEKSWSNRLEIMLFTPGERRGSRTEPTMLRNLEPRQRDCKMANPTTQRREMAAAGRAVGRSYRAQVTAGRDSEGPLVTRVSFDMGDGDEGESKPAPILLRDLSSVNMPLSALCVGSVSFKTIT